MRTSNTSRLPSFASRAVLAMLLAVLASTSGRAPVRAQSTGAAASAPVGQSVTLLPDGRWLVIGGGRTPGLVQIRGLDGTVVTLPVSPLTPRAWHTATVLSDGSILLVGGIDARGQVLTAPERFTPGTETFEPLSADGLAPRAHHTATLLTDGRVLLVGGMASTVRDDADLWDPAAGRGQPVGATPQSPRTDQHALLEANGRVLIAGGTGADGRPAVSAEEFDPSTMTFQALTEPPLDPATFAVSAVNPPDSAQGIAADAIVTLRFSQAANVASVSDNTVSIAGPDGPVSVALVSAEAGRLLFVRPADPLQLSTHYRVNVSGIVSSTGPSIAAATFSFTTKDEPKESGKADDERWTPSGMDGWSSGRKPSPWQSLPPLSAPLGVTAVAGQVLRLNGAPLARVTLAIDGQTTRTDRSGRFLLVVDGLAQPERTLAIDARTANQGSKTYGFYEARIRVKAGTTTVLPFTIWSPVLDTANGITIPSPTLAETVVRTPTMPGLELHLPQGTVIRGEDGAVVRTVTMTPIPLDRTPFPLPADAPFTMFFTIQPGGAYISTPGPIKGGWLVYPNRTTFRPGTKVQFFNYDPDDKGWYVYGLGTVTRTQVVPDPKTRFYAFTGASFNSGPTPPPPETGTPKGDPVNASSGAFIMEKTDLVLPDVMPIALTRTYDARDTQQRAFGTGMTHAYGMFQYTTNSFNTGELILPDAEQIQFVRTSADGLPWYQTVFECQSGPTPFYKSQLLFSAANTWEYHLKDGTVYVMGHQAALQAIRDRYGNETHLTWSDTNIWGAGVGNLVKITSPNGRWVAFTYDSASPVNHVTQATDNIGRTVTYTYDAHGNLSTVTDPVNNVTTYTWDTSNRLVSIKDGRNITWLTNQYDTSNRVTQQALADPTATYGFAYTTDGNGNITQTDVTDPRAHVERLAFNADHYTTSDTEAYGTSLARTTTITRQTGTDFVTEVIDPLNRRTDYTYDTSGHVLTTTRLAATSNAVTTTFTYEPVFFQLASVTDPLNHTWSLAYDSSGKLTSTTDPLSHQTTVSMALSGLITQITDPLQHSWQFGYAAGDLTSFTDPLGNIRSQFVDEGGRVISSTDPLGRASRTAYDKINRVTSVTDPVGGVTSFTYDANSNLLSLTDALTHTTSFTYDNSDRVATRTDPLTHAATYAYDLKDHLSQVTDRKSQVTGYTYDALDRLTQVTFNDTSTIAYTYDAGDRITQIADSANGTITRQFDGLNRLTEETTPQGTIDYAYDAADRRTSMTVAGQTAVSYGYDNANRLTTITQGTATASLAYDDASRRNSLTYPNGIVATYSYDTANHLAGITFTLGQTTLGTLTYTYDAAGNRTTVGGSWARSALPPALTSATYDAANRIVTWAGVSSTYDLNGNLTGDGTNSYTWNARNQLTAITGGASASFAYDAVARRRQKTVSGTTTSFLYDGLSLAQELSGGSPTTNLLGGPDIDEILTRTDAGGTASLLADALGSTIALTDTSGTVQTAYTYEPFGQATMTGATTTNSIGFTGRETDGTGLDFYRARYYDPTKQRFDSEDPLGFDGGDVNLYAYVTNTPTQMTDPMGLLVYIPRPGSPCAPPIGGRKDPSWPFRRFVCSVTAVPLPFPLLAPEPFFPPPFLPPFRGPMGPGHPNWRPPTNTPQMPPEQIPDGWRVRTEPPRPGYPDGSWKLEKPLPDGSWQPIDPSTMRPGSRPETHIPFPPLIKPGGGT